MNTGDLCPAGWHVPSNNEWNLLNNYLGNDSYAGGKLKITGTNYWQGSNLRATNETGFSALPSGKRDVNGLFAHEGVYANWWCDTELDDHQTPVWSLDGINDNFVNETLNYYQYGLSVRCIKDAGPLYPAGSIPESYEQLANIPLFSITDTVAIPLLKKASILPDSIILKVPEPGKQESYNSCSAWAVGYGNMSYLFKFFEGHDDYLYENHFSPPFIYNMNYYGVDNGIPISVAVDHVKNYGCCKITDMDYKTAPDVPPTDIAIQNALKFKITDYYRLNNDKNLIKTIISKGYPVIIGARVDNAFRKNEDFDEIDGKILWKEYKYKYAINRAKHAMLLCGYDDKINAYKVLNSYGSNWGDGGFIWIDYDFFNSVIVDPAVIDLPSIFLITVKRPYVLTGDITDITNVSAKCKVKFLKDWGLDIANRGVCWNVSGNPTIDDNKTEEGTGNVDFTSDINGLNANTTYHVKAYASNSEGISYGKQATFTTTSTLLSIGQIYSGGIIFYIDSTRQHGLVAAKTDQHSGIQWYNGKFVVTGATNKMIGSGQENTNKIISALGEGEYAASICDKLT